MIKITGKLADDTLAAAKTAERRRNNHNFHEDFSHPINRMLNAMEPEAYFPPHKHENPAKVEVFVILKGRVVILEFDDAGKIKDHVILDPRRESYGVEIPLNAWHSLIPLESSVLYEIKEGPYDKDSDKTFASWAPGEGDPEAVAYVRGLLGEIGIKQRS